MGLQYLIEKKRPDPFNLGVNIMTKIALLISLVICSVGVRAHELGEIDASALKHPYILFKSEDIPRLNEKRSEQPFKQMWENINSASPQDTDGVVNAFIYALTGDTARGAQAKKALMELCAIKSWSNNSPPKLQVSEKCRPAGLIYDMIYDLLSEQERRDISQKIIDAAIVPIYKHSFGSWWSQRRQHNYSPTFASGWGIAALAVLREHPDAVEWIERAVMRINLFMSSQGTDGGYGEGINYTNMSLRGIMPFMDGIENVFGVNMYENTWLCGEVPLFFVYCLSPDRRSTLNFNDAGIDRIYDHHVMIRLAGKCGSEDVRRIVNEDIIGVQDPKTEISFDWPGFGGKPEDRQAMKVPSDIFSYLWLDSGAKKAPSYVLPRSKFFSSIGWAVFRSGWEKDDLQLGVISAPKFFGNHEHADRGSFIFNAYGERLISDSGKPTGYDDPLTVSWFRESVAHNVMLVEGKGQTMTDKLIRGGEMSNFLTSRAYDYVLTKNAGPYGELVDKWDRHVVFAGGEFAILLDDVSLPQAGEVEFRFHSPSSHTIKLDGDTAIFPGNNGGDIPRIPPAKRQFELPMKEKYPDWWATGNPMPQIEPWTSEDETTADLVLETFSKYGCVKEVTAGFQDYRFPSTYLSNKFAAVKDGKFVTVLYPRSAQMKSDGRIPVIKRLNENAVSVSRDGKVWNIISDSTKQEFDAGAFEQKAVMSAVQYNGGLFHSFIMIDGIQLKAADVFEFISDMPLTVIGVITTGSMSFNCVVSSQCGADLRISLPKEPGIISVNGEPRWVSVTDKLVEMHIDQGSNEIIIIQ